MAFGTSMSEPYEGDVATRRELADKFAPCLILFPEITKADDKPDETDYHPRDVRLVLSRVWSRASHQGSGLPGFLARAGRQLPFPIIVATMVALFLCDSLLVALILVESEPSTRDTIGQWILPLMVLYGIPVAVLAVLLSIAAHSSLRVLPKRRVETIAALLTVITFWLVTEVLLIALLFSLVTGIDFVTWPPELKGIFIFLWGLPLYALGAVPMYRLFFSRRGPGLLEQLEIEKSNRDKRSQYFEFVGAGSPGDKVGHRKLYRDVRAGTVRPIGSRLRTTRSAEEIEKEYPTTTYVRFVRGKDRWAQYIAIQYWLAYFYNDWANTHEMDWEQVTVYAVLRHGGIAERATPVACGFSAHVGGIVAPWSEVVGDTNRALHQYWNRPLVYVARGSHANYPEPGVHRPTMRLLGQTLTWDDVPFLRSGDRERYLDCTLDYATGQKVIPRSKVLLPDPVDGVWPRSACPCSPCPNYGQLTRCANPQPSCSEDFRWLNLNGVWGSPGGILGGDSAPQSPPMQDSWRDPFAWLEACVSSRGTESAAAEMLLSSTGHAWKRRSRRRDR